MLCPKCNASIDDDSKFCVECGEKLPESIALTKSKSCPNCGIVTASGNYCTNCGTNLYDDSLVSQNEPTRLQQAQLQFQVAQTKLQQQQLKVQEKQLKLQEKQLKRVLQCPKCGSTSLSGNKKGFGIGKAVVGAWLVGPLGLVAGNIGAKKVRVTCMNCGYKFWAGKK